MHAVFRTGKDSNVKEATHIQTYQRSRLPDIVLEPDGEPKRMRRFCQETVVSQLVRRSQDEAGYRDATLHGRKQAWWCTLSGPESDSPGSGCKPAGLLTAARTTPVTEMPPWGEENMLCQGWHGWAPLALPAPDENRRCTK